jgi:D-3-phosphoglycerate dehydrogenase
MLFGSWVRCHLNEIRQLSCLTGQHLLSNPLIPIGLRPIGHARGTVVNTNDLIRAFREGLVAGAGLDVLEEEPDVPADLAEFENVLLTPHVAGRSPASFIAQTHALMQSLGEVADGRSCTFQVPEMQWYSPKSADK